MKAASLRRLTRWLVPAALGAAVVSASATADAAAPLAGADGKRFRLHGELDVLSFYHWNPDGDGPSYNGGGFGIGRTTLIDAGGGVGAVLHPRPVWSLGFGFLLADYRAILGFKVAFAVDGFGDDDPDDTGDPSTTLISGQFVPYFRWMFLPGKRFRPFVDVHAGVGGGTVILNNSDTDTRAATSLLWPNAGGGGGVNIFVIDAFSVDFGLMFDYFAPFAATDTETPAMDTDEDLEKAGDVFDVSAQAGLSVWF